MASSMYTKEHHASRHSRQQGIPQPVLIEPPGSTGGDRKLDGRGLRFAIISTRWYDKEVNPLVKGCKDELLSKGVQPSDIDEYQVPGAYELPFVASRLIKTKSKKQKKQQLAHHEKPGPHEVDAVICIGCMVKGGTMAYEFVSEAATMGLMKLNVMSDTPVVLGLLTRKSFDQAKQCGASLCACVAETESLRHSSHVKPICNHGVEWAQEAIELAHLKRSTNELLAMKTNRNDQCKESDCPCSCHCQSCKCKTCTCTECECKSCYHNIQRPQEHEDRKMMQQFDNLGVCATSTGTRSSAESAICVGCGKSSQNCGCRDCNCASCATKSSGSESPGNAQVECPKCGNKQQVCVCEPSSSKTSTTRP